MRLPFRPESEELEEAEPRFEVMPTPDGKIYARCRMGGMVFEARVEYTEYGGWRIPEQGLENLDANMRAILNEFRGAIESEANRRFPNGPERNS